MKDCKMCGESFDESTRSWRAEYCSEKCRSKYYRDAVKDTPSGIMRRYKSSAKDRGHEFDLPLEIFIDNMDAECHYCGTKLKKAALDRKDSSIGYIVDNVVPCCWECNAMKRTKSYDTFIERCRKITIRLNN